MAHKLESLLLKRNCRKTSSGESVPAQRIPFIALLVVSLLNSGCAALLHGTEQAVQVRSKDPQAQIFLDGRYLGSGEVTVWLEKKRHPKFTVKKAGCKDVDWAVPKRVDNLTFLGIAIDLGLVSILLVDWAITGAVHQFHPTKVTLTPQCPGAL